MPGIPVNVLQAWKPAQMLAPCSRTYLHHGRTATHFTKRPLHRPFAQLKAFGPAIDKHASAMKLSDKGPIRPAPQMPATLERVSIEIQTWPGVIAATHWDLYRPDQADGADFYLADAEIGHIHFGGEADIATDAALYRRFTQAQMAQPFRYRADPGYRDWTQISIQTPQQVRHAMAVFRANYERLRDCASPSAWALS